MTSLPVWCKFWLAVTDEWLQKSKSHSIPFVPILEKTGQMSCLWKLLKPFYKNGGKSNMVEIDITVCGELSLIQGTQWYRIFLSSVIRHSVQSYLHKDTFSFNPLVVLDCLRSLVKRIRGLSQKSEPNFTTFYRIVLGAWKYPARGRRKTWMMDKHNVYPPK